MRARGGCNDVAVACFLWLLPRRRALCALRMGAFLLVIVLAALPFVFLACLNHSRLVLLRGHCYSVLFPRRCLAAAASLRLQLEQTISDYADEGLRTLCIAERIVTGMVDSDVTELEKDLTLVGLVGIEDPLRKEVPGAIQVRATDDGRRWEACWWWCVVVVEEV